MCQNVKNHSPCFQVNTSFSLREPETGNTFSNLAKPIWQCNIFQPVFAVEGKRREKLKQKEQNWESGICSDSERPNSLDGGQRVWVEAR